MQFFSRKINERAAKISRVINYDRINIYHVRCSDSGECFSVRFSANETVTWRFVWKSHYDFCPTVIFMQGKRKTWQTTCTFYRLVLSFINRSRRIFFGNIRRGGLGREGDEMVKDTSLFDMEGWRDFHDDLGLFGAASTLLDRSCRERRNLKRNSVDISDTLPWLFLVPSYQISCWLSTDCVLPSATGCLFNHMC